MPQSDQKRKGTKAVVRWAYAALSPNWERILLLLEELSPEREEHHDEGDEPAHLRESNRGAKKPVRMPV